ncbi:UDP-N-Acetylglucosamine 2-epimerase [Chthonomonas calidirosea]|uniref:UDP-N-acetylglucosamine 2-epimerase (non-hydrolyzing) n=1 Tax=Chthonomonas calidirosea (strain DSM 23976 / ICMP 18418 / T49) TaxID=1303518 RepID=S0EWK3_CHTCT|nr:UDP-N-acetylglucosamine 2-epimerase (non-hydrolyzing) [Chthonomonas calidirosea]CCW36283.1 UDP-N-Acetylglucosamine 2-epimerase [Chthonomonas calidirosea T49]CEK17793.1 UDP-N-Acetylglucosamine 2-epimerase [Chthonomonas calidirosea]
MAEASVPKRVLCVFGTRPDTVKMAPVVHALKRYPQDFTVRVVVTGQHREQMEQALRVFQITPDCDLAIMQHGQTLAQITIRALEGLDAELSSHPADICLAQGDTTTTFVAALAAFYHKVPFGHVEAGLRTGQRYDPFPEEMNRRLTAPLATWHFAPTEQARENLLREGIAPHTIFVTGNTSIDALLSVAAQPATFDDARLKAIVESDRRLILVTAHRRENWGAPMERIARALALLAQRFPDCTIVVAMHRNPIVRQTLQSVLADVEGVVLVEPQEYVPFVHLMKRATLILTDSGGVQEEAPALGVPVLVLRETTERPEGVAAGTNRLVGTDVETIVAEASRLLNDPEAYAQMARAVNPYGDGHAAERIVAVLRQSEAY